MAGAGLAGLSGALGLQKSGGKPLRLEALDDRHLLSPFFCGLFREPELASSSRTFDFVFKSFSRSHAALPANGMAAIPAQLAHGLAPKTLRLNNPRCYYFQTERSPLKRPMILLSAVGLPLPAEFD